MQERIPVKFPSISENNTEIMARPPYKNYTKSALEFEKIPKSFLKHC